jgi:predicted ATPase
LVKKGGLGLIDNLVWREAKALSNTYEVRSGGKLIAKKRNTLLVVPTILAGRTQISFSQLSEGTFRTLALLFYIINDDTDLLLIEEPEMCVHHGLLASMVEVIKDSAEHKQVIISTHSDHVVDQVRPENVFLVKNEGRKGTRIGPVSAAMSKTEYVALKEYLRSAGNLGEYWRDSGF